MIKLENVSKIFYQHNQPITALNNINLSVPTGQIFGVIGTSGAGKSTLIRCINLLERPTSGSVIVDDVDLTSLSNRKLTRVRHKISMIFQHFNLLSSRTVFENVAFPLELEHTPRKIIQARVLELLELVGLSNKANVYPANLSGGQKQRVAIARALASQPKVLLCDEATSALDPATTRSILDLLKDINRKLNLTILLITHEMDVVKQICDQVAVISQGQLVEHSAVGQMFSRPKTAIAKEFIQSTLHLHIPEDYLQKLHSTRQPDTYPLLRLDFSGLTVDAPLLSQITKQFNVENNIISAQMDYAGGVKFGIMLTEMIGDENDINNAINFLIKNNTQVEVIGYV